MPVSSEPAGKKLPVIRVRDKCTRCKKCMKSCPVEILVVTRDQPVVQVIDPSGCLECRACEVICPESAIEVN
ncbi:MAG: 4Fe-4S dicluster domain-containing protein [Candidatus Hodarchaeales archaeon]|jgi:NAD-dependent dihydropyrimidine dehydrogenase PreA subunit